MKKKQQQKTENNDIDYNIQTKKCNQFLNIEKKSRLPKKIYIYKETLITNKQTNEDQEAKDKERKKKKNSINIKINDKK